MNSENTAAIPIKEELIALLKNGKIEEFNRVRPEGKIDLRWADLIRADLTGADLTGADLHGACLMGACLTRANLTRANLSWAILSEANLTGAIFTDRQERFFLFRLLDWFKSIFGASWK